MDTDMIEVDPQLFVKCRLCLDNMGLYQIIPIIQQQIKHCFNIDVAPYDGLPQLLCKICESTLSKFYATKETFIKKQQQLIKSVQKESISQPQHDISNQELHKSDDQLLTLRSKKRVKLSPLAGAICLKEMAQLVSNKMLKQRNSTWKDNYIKYFMCRICEQHFSTLFNLQKHITKTHKRLLYKNKVILKSTPIVALNKVDDLPNITGLPDTVVYNKKKILQNNLNADLYTVYYLSKLNVVHKNSGSTTTLNQSNKCVPLTNLSDDDKKKQCKKRRLNDNHSSADSNYKRKSNTKPLFAYENSGTQCFIISDSDEEISVKAGRVTSSDIQSELQDMKEIQNIITMCCEKYNGHDTENESSNYECSSNLHEQKILHKKHKYFSLKKTIIYGQGHDSLGLLRYMETKNLDIKWSPTPYIDVIENKFVSTFVKIAGQKVDDNDNGWLKLINTLDDHIISNIQHNEEHIGSIINNVIGLMYNQKPIECKDHTKNSILLNESPVSNPKQLLNKGSEAMSDTACGSVPNILRQDRISISNDISNGILDSSGYMPIITSTVSLAPPVPNNNINKPSGDSTGQVEISNKNITSEVFNAHNSNSWTKDNMNKSNGDNMGKIKTPNTDSLLMMANTGNSKPWVTDMKESNDDNKVQVKVPNREPIFQATDAGNSTSWIKVKPVSQLMPRNIVNNINIQANQNNLVLGPQTPPQPYTMNVVNTLPVLQNSVMSSPMQQFQVLTLPNTPNVLQMPQIVEPVAPPTTLSSPNCVIMHTLELPYTETNSPFTYLKNLLHLHGIILLNITDMLPDEFICLVRFRLSMVHDQEKHMPPRAPVFLNVSVFCNKNVFTIQVKGSYNNQNVDINKLNAHIQWEVLKACRGEVIKDILSNAMRMGGDVLECANNFVNRLKSINILLCQNV